MKVFQQMKEWLKIMVSMPAKPVKYGMKLFILFDSTNGQCNKFDVHVGSDERKIVNLGKTGKTVWNLFPDLENSITSPCTYGQLLYQSHSFSCNEKHRFVQSWNCEESQRFSMNELKAVQTRQRGDIAWLSWNSSMLALKWKDRKEIFALSTIHSSPVPRPAPRVHDNKDGNTTVTRRVKERGQWRQLTISCPHLIKYYKMAVSLLIYLLWWFL